MRGTRPDRSIETLTLAVDPPTTAARTRCSAPPGASHAPAASSWPRRSHATDVTPRLSTCASRAPPDSPSSSTRAPSPATRRRGGPRPARRHRALAGAGWSVPPPSRTRKWRTPGPSLTGHATMGAAMTASVRWRPSWPRSPRSPRLYPLTASSTPSPGCAEPTSSSTVTPGRSGLVRSCRGLGRGAAAGLRPGLLVGLVRLHGQGHLYLGCVPDARHRRGRPTPFGRGHRDGQALLGPRAHRTTGSSFGLTVLVGFVAICVDALAVTTWRSPAAGRPATAHGIPHHGRQLATGWRWLLRPPRRALARPAATTARARSRAGARRTPPTQRGRRGGARPRRAAIVLRSGPPTGCGRHRAGARRGPADRAPHFPPRFLTDGLGRADGSRRWRSSVGFNDTIDLSRSLNDQDQTPVLSYTTTAVHAEPAPGARDVVLLAWPVGRDSAPTAGPDASRTPAARVKRTGLRHQRQRTTPSPPQHRRALPRGRGRDGRHTVDDRPCHARRPRRPRGEQLPRDVCRPGQLTAAAAYSGTPGLAAMSPTTTTPARHVRVADPVVVRRGDRQQGQPARQGDRDPGPPARAELHLLPRPRRAAPRPSHRAR